MIDMLCSWNPIDLLSIYKENKQDDLIQMEYFHHITNHVSRQHWHIRHANMKPVEYLYVEMSEVQQVLIKPTQKYLSVCGSGLRHPVAYSLLGGGVPYPYHRLHWSLDSVPSIRFLCFPS